MKTRTKGVSVIGVALLSVIVGLAVLTFGQSTGMGPMSKLVVYAAGIPDSYGNRIVGIYIQQNASGTWTTITSISYTTFVNGTTLSIPANVKTNIWVQVNLNSTFAADLATAITRTRVYITITGVVTSGLMPTSAGGYSGGGFYTTFHWYPSAVDPPASVWTPATDTTYTVTLQYQAYY